MKPDSSNNKTDFSLSECVGLSVEIADLNNRLIAFGKIINIYKGVITLHIHNSSLTEQISDSIYVSLRGFSSVNKKAVYLEGKATQKDDDTLVLSSVKLHKILNDRAFYRLDTTDNATITIFYGMNAGEYNCNLINISIGGVAIETTKELHIADTFLLKARVNSEYEEFVVFCKVRRKSDCENGVFKYGCQFMELSEEEQTRLAREIFSVQTMRRKT